MGAELSGIPPMFYITFAADEPLEINSPLSPGFSGAEFPPFFPETYLQLPGILIRISEKLNLIFDSKKIRLMIVFFRLACDRK
jgi:hypothetical protein